MNENNRRPGSGVAQVETDIVSDQYALMIPVVKLRDICSIGSGK